MYVVSVAATGVKLPSRISVPLTSPVATAAPIISPNPSSMVVTAAPSLTKKEATTTRKPASGPTERSMPPVSRATFCPTAMNPRAATSIMIEVMLKAER